MAFSPWLLVRAILFFRRSTERAYSRFPSSAEASLTAQVCSYYGRRLAVTAYELHLRHVRYDVPFQCANRLGFIVTSRTAKNTFSLTSSHPVIAEFTASLGTHHVLLIPSSTGKLCIAGTSAFPGVDAANLNWLLSADRLIDFQRLQKASPPYDRFLLPHWLVLMADIVRPAWPQFTVGATLSVAIAILSFISPVVIARYFASMTSAAVRDTHYLLMFFCLLACSRFILWIVRSANTKLVASTLDTVNGARLTEKLLKLPLYFFHQAATSEVLGYMEDVFLITRTLTITVPALVTNTVFLLTSITAVAVLHKGLLLYVSVYLGITLLYQRHNQHKLINQGHALRNLRSELVTHLIDTCLTIKVIKVYTQEIQVLKRIKVAYEAASAAYSRVTATMAFGQALNTLIATGCIIALLLAGAHLLSDRILTFAELLAIYTAFASFTASLEGMPTLLTDIADAAGALIRLRDIQSCEEEVDLHATHSTPVLACPPGIALRCEAVTFSYPGADRARLADLTLEVYRGEVVGIRGLTGAGKSTLAMLMPALYKATSGTLSINGQSVASWEQSELRKTVGIVFTEAILTSSSIYENLRGVKPDATQEEIEDAAILTCAHEFITELKEGYHLRLKSGGGLSSGQKQRIALAMAALRNPDILVLDEATSHLDIATEERVLRNLLRYRAGLTTIIISHRIQTMSYVTRIIDLS